MLASGNFKLNDDMTTDESAKGDALRKYGFIQFPRR